MNDSQIKNASALAARTVDRAERIIEILTEIQNAPAVKVAKLVQRAKAEAASITVEARSIERTAE